MVKDQNALMAQMTLSLEEPSVPRVYLNKLISGRRKILQLLTKKIESQLRANHKANADGEKTFAPIVKLFNPYGVGTWYLSELDDNDIAFGYCNLGYETELGYVDLNELKSMVLPFGGKVERDLYWSGDIQ